MIEEPLGRVIVTGGYDGSKYLNTIYKLEHSDIDWKWVKLDVELKIARRYHVTAFISSEMVNCTTTLKLK